MASGLQPETSKGGIAVKRRNHSSALPGERVAAVLLIMMVHVADAQGAELGEVPLDARIPLVVIHQGREVAPSEMASVLAGLDAPVLRGNALRTQLALAPRFDPDVAAKVRRSFTEGEDLFFAGNHAEGEAKLQSVIQTIETNPHLLFYVSDLRMLAFKSHIYLAVIAAGDDKDDLVNMHLFGAKAYREFQPSPNEFPPWVCERFDSQGETGNDTEQRSTIHLDAPGDCELLWQGRSLGRGPSFTEIPPGTHSVRVRCNEETSPIQILRVEGNSDTRHHPLLLGASRVEETRSDVTLVATGKHQRNSIVRDILQLAERTHQHRWIAIVGTENRISVWLIDKGTGRIIRESSAIAKNPEGARLAGRAMSREPATWNPTGSARQKRRWYRDPTAWTLTGTGAALLGAGIALFSVYGRPSKLEPAALGFTVMGAGLFGTGITLFFLPRPSQFQDRRPTANTVYTIGVARSF